MAELHQAVLRRNVSYDLYGKNSKKGYGRIIAVWLKPHQIVRAPFTHKVERRKCIKPQVWVAILENKTGVITERPIVEIRIINS